MQNVPNFQYVDEPRRDMLCSICLKPWYDPVETPCEHIFCEGCLTAALKRSPSCPECRTDVRGAEPKRATRVLRQQVEKLIVHCLAKDLGCAWTGARETYPSHHETGCVKKPAPVPREEGPMQATVASEYDAYGSGVETKAFTMLHLTAPVLPPELLDRARKPIHVSAVLDVSGSMGGEKLNLLKDTMRFVVREMGPQDSLAVTTYSSNAALLFGDTPMDDAGKAMALAAVEGIRCSGNTNISEGLFLGLAQFGFQAPADGGPPMAARRLMSGRNVTEMLGASYKRVAAMFTPTPAPVAKTLDDDTRSVWLLTDGQANYGLTDKSSFVAAMSGVMGPRKDVSVYTFGFGTPHNQDLLSAISETGGGQYYFIKDLDSIKKNFADCLGGLMSVVVNTIEIHATVAPGVRLLRVMGDDKAVNGNKCRTVIRDLQSEEQRDIVVEVLMPALSAPDTTPRALITWSVSYVSALDSTTWTCDRTATVTRPLAVGGDVVPNVKVVEQRARVEVMDAMESAEKMCNMGNYASAQEVLTSVRTRHSHMLPEDSATGRQLKSRTESAITSSSAQCWQEEGKYRMRSMHMEQKCQRTCDADDEGGMYTNATKSAMKKRAT